MNRNPQLENLSNVENLENETIEGENPKSAFSESLPLPRPKRRRKKSNKDRGLPDDAELARLADAYLEEIHQLYPAALSRGAIPAATPETINEMVKNFKYRHRGGSPDSSKIREQLKSLGMSKAAGAYSRFSHENSNPTSIVDQMINCLKKGASERRFIPWEYVYADFAISGLDASRQGYRSYKKLLSDKDQWVDTTYIDDFTRPSRDEMEWWKLAHLSKGLHKRMIGASDAFDLSSPDWDLKVTIYGLISRQFIKSLREKVTRGMKGAARRRTSLGKLSLGFTRRQKIDPSGKLVVGSEGRPIHEPCIDVETSEYRRLMCELFVVRNWSIPRIAKYFNEIKVDGWNGWTATAIRKLLWSATAIGVFVWNKTHREFDLEEERWVVVKNPRSEWVVYYSRDLAIVPLDQWRAARRKLAEARRRSRRTGRKPTRNERSPSTLFSGTLFCACCKDNELKLMRSADGHQQLGSVSGRAKAHDCRLSTSKSTRIIEECLLNYLRDHLLTPELVTELVVKANAHLEQESQKPIPETAHLHKRVTKRERMITRLVRQVSETDDRDVAARYDAEIRRLTRENKEDQSVLSAAQAAESRAIERLDLETAMRLLADLRSVLDEDIAVAGPAIREITGPISIRQEPIPGRSKRCRWIAAFTPQVATLISKLSPSECAQFAAKSLPAANTVEVVIDKVPNYEKMAKEFQSLRDKGASPASIAATYRVNSGSVIAALHFADTGERPTRRANNNSQNPRKTNVCYKAIAADVVRMVEEEELNRTEILARLDVCSETVQRAYDYLRPDATMKAVESGKRPRRFRAAILPKHVFEKIRKLADTGVSVKEIAKEAGCGRSTVNRELKRLAEERQAGSRTDYENS